MADLLTCAITANDEDAWLAEIKLILAFWQKIFLWKSIFGHRSRGLEIPFTVSYSIKTFLPLDSTFDRPSFQSLSSKRRRHSSCRLFDDDFVTPHFFVIGFSILSCGNSIKHVVIIDAEISTIHIANSEFPLVQKKSSLQSFIPEDLPVSIEAKTTISPFSVPVIIDAPSFATMPNVLTPNMTHRHSEEFYHHSEEFY